jgi:Bacterial protein of unknown function (DUF937)
VRGGSAQYRATPLSATGLISLINGANLGVASLGNIAGLFDGGSGVIALLEAGTGSEVPGLFGGKASTFVKALSSSSGIKTASATHLFEIIVPQVLALLKKFMGDKSLNANSLSSLLAGQGPNLQGELDSRMSPALGFASPDAFLGGLRGQAADTAMLGAGGADAETRRVEISTQ